MEFEIEKKDECEEIERILQRELSPMDRLSFANKIMLGLFISFAIITVFLGFNKDLYGKLVFNVGMTLINTFGSFIMGFYFSRK